MLLHTPLSPAPNTLATVHSAVRRVERRWLLAVLLVVIVVLLAAVVGSAILLVMSHVWGLWLRQGSQAMSYALRWGVQWVGVRALK